MVFRVSSMSASSTMALKEFLVVAALTGSGEDIGIY